MARDASAAGISLRTGCTVDDFLALTGLPSGGAVRVSLGLASDLGDLDRFLDFAERTYRDAEPDRDGLPPRLHC